MRRQQVYLSESTAFHVRAALEQYLAQEAKRRGSARAADRPRRRREGPDRRGREPRSRPLRRAEGRQLRSVGTVTARGAGAVAVFGLDADFSVLGFALEP